ncbi:MAG: hypothetical protein ABEI96_06595 [Haloarculaceae archaeon]
MAAVGATAFAALVWATVLAIAAVFGYEVYLLVGAWRRRTRPDRS